MSWGLSAPVATFAAQVQQESGWRTDARSRFAAGLAQFTPDTAAWIGSIDAGLSAADAANPVWALRALTRYDKWLFDRVPPSPFSAQCIRMAQTLRAYNGGLGWLQKEAKSGKPCRYFRSESSCTENLAYPLRILNLNEPQYVRAGWGIGSC